MKCLHQVRKRIPTETTTHDRIIYGINVHCVTCNAFIMWLKTGEKEL